MHANPMSGYASWVITGLLLVGLLVAMRVGRWLRGRLRTPEDAAGGGLLEAAVFGLLGLLLAFQFARSSSGLDLRRDLVLGEANAIGTAYLRLDLIKEEAQPAIRELLRQFTDARIRSRELLPDFHAAIAEVNRGRGFEGEIWRLAVEACRDDPWPPAATLLLPALNEVFDTAAARDVAALTHAPWPVVGLFLGVAMLGGLLAGMTTTERDRTSRLKAIAFACVMALTVFVVFDMEFPRSGIIRVGVADTALQDVRAAMDAPRGVQPPRH